MCKSRLRNPLRSLEEGELHKLDRDGSIPSAATTIRGCPWNGAPAPPRGEELELHVRDETDVELAWYCAAAMAREIRPLDEGCGGLHVARTTYRQELDPMNWIGAWKNQYGSVLDITSDEGGNITGWFTSAVDGGIKDERIQVSGFHAADRLTFCLAGGPIVAAWTGLLRNDRLETLWHVAASERRTAPVEGADAVKRQLDIFEAFTTGADTFVRIDRGR